MIQFGMDVDTSGRTACSVKVWPTDHAAAMQLFVYGTEPGENSICPDISRKALKLTQQMLQINFEVLQQSAGAEDLGFSAVKISDILQTVHQRVREISHYLGEGIYLGGSIFYSVGANYILTSFGGGYAYSCIGGKVKRIGHKDYPGDLIDDALGCENCHHRGWRPNFWKGLLKPGESIFFMTERLGDSDQAASELQNTVVPGSHPNTAAMVLRRILDTQDLPSAVLEIRHESRGT